MKIIITIFLLFITMIVSAQVPVIQRGTSTQVTLDQREMAGMNFYLPRVLGIPTLRPSLQNGGVDTLGAQVFNILDSSVYHWFGGNIWEKDLIFRDTLGPIATKNYVLNHTNIWGGITGNINSQVDLQNEFATTVKYTDTTNGKIATPFYVNAQGFLKTETDPIANAKTVSVSSGYGLSGGGSAALSTNPSFTLSSDTTKLIPYTDTLKTTTGIATKSWVQSQNYLIFADTGRCANCIATGGGLLKAIDSLAFFTGVTSFNFRIGAIIPQTGDYTYSQVSQSAGLPANQTFTGANTFNGSVVINFGEILNGVPTGLSTDSILTIINGVVRKIPSFSSTFLTYVDTGRCVACIATGGGLYKVVDSLAIAVTTGVTSFNGRNGIVIPRANDYGYDSLMGHGSLAIDSVGTIIQGTWNASPIINAYLANSTINFSLDNTTTLASWSATSAPLGGGMTLHLPLASASNTNGLVTNSAQTFGGTKTFANGWIISANSTPIADSTYALGSLTLRFNNLYTALPSYNSGLYALTVENYTNGRLETLPFNSFVKGVTNGLYDSLQYVGLGGNLVKKTDLEIPNDSTFSINFNNFISRQPFFIMSPYFMSMGINTTGGVTGSIISPSDSTLIVNGGTRVNTVTLIAANISTPLSVTRLDLTKDSLTIQGNYNSTLSNVSWFSINRLNGIRDSTLSNSNMNAFLQTDAFGNFKSADITNLLKIDTVLTTTTNYTVTNTYKTTRVILNAVSGTITLPDPTLSVNRNLYVFIRVNSSGQTATVVPAVGNIETSLGVFSTSATITGIPNQGWVSNGTNWVLSN